MLCILLGSVFWRWMDKWMNSCKYSTGLYHSEIIGINTTNIELILLVFMGDIFSQWLAMYIYFTSYLQYLYIAHRYWHFYTYIIIGGFNIHIYIIPYIHGLELIFTDWTDTEDIYIYIFILWFSRKRRKLLQQNRTEQLALRAYCGSACYSLFYRLRGDWNLPFSYMYYHLVRWMSHFDLRLGAAIKGCLFCLDNNYFVTKIILPYPFFITIRIRIAI